MKIRLLAVCTLVASTSAACTANITAPKIDAEKALGSFMSPQGRFGKGNAGKTFSAQKTERDESKSVDTPKVGDEEAASEGGVKQQAKRSLLRRLSNDSSSCTEGEACACETSGTFQYTRKEGKIGTMFEMKFDKCTGDDGISFTGDGIAVVSDKPIAGIEKKAPVASKQAPSKNVLIAASGEATEGGKSTNVDFAVLLEAGWTLVAVNVGEGDIVVGATDDGSMLIVKAKDASYTCNAVKSGYRCTSDTDGEQFEVSESGEGEEATEGEAPSTETSEEPAADEGEADG